MSYWQCSLYCRSCSVSWCPISQLFFWKPEPFVFCTQVKIRDGDISRSVYSFVGGLVGMDPQVGQTLNGLSLIRGCTLCLCISSHGYFVPLLRRSKVSTLWSSFFLSFMLSMNCILGILGFVANIHVSVNAYHVSSFVIGLPHSEYFLVLSSCPKISWSRSLYLRSTLNKTPKAYALTSRVDKWHLIKLQSFCKAKDTVNQTKQQPSDWEKIFTHLHPIEG